METADMIHAFRALQSNESRREALETLVRELSPYEWRAVQSLVNARTFQFDIIGSLPTELVALVFSYLNTSAPFYFQRVSKRWYTVLRSLDVIKQSLRAWYDDNSRLEGADYKVCEQKARTIHRFRHGNILDHTAIREEGRPLPFGAPILAEDYLVGMTKRAILVNNLRNGKFWQSHGEAREEVCRVAASDQIVAFATTLNVCYVSDIRGDQRKKFRLTNRMFSVLSCRDRIVVCGSRSTGFAEIYVWDFDTQKGRSFQLSYTQEPFKHRINTCPRIDTAILLHPVSRTLTVFSSDRCESKLCCPSEGYTHCTIYYTRLTFDGNPIQNGEFCVADLAGTWISDIRPVDRRGGFRVDVDAREPARLESERVSFSFNEQLWTFKKVDHPASTKWSSWWINAKVAWWKDSFYKVFPDVDCKDTETQGDDCRELLLAHLGTSDHFKFKPLLLDTITDRRPSKPRFLLNDKFAVILDTRGGYVHIISFEVQLPVGIKPASPRFTNITEDIRAL